MYAMLLFSQNNSQTTSVAETQESQHKESAHQDSQLDDILSLIDKGQHAEAWANSSAVEESQDLLGMEEKQVLPFKIIVYAYATILINKKMFFHV